MKTFNPRHKGSDRYLRACGRDPERHEVRDLFIRAAAAEYGTISGGDAEKILNLEIGEKHTDAQGVEWERRS